VAGFRDDLALDSDAAFRNKGLKPRPAHIGKGSASALSRRSALDGAGFEGFEGTDIMNGPMNSRCRRPAHAVAPPSARLLLSVVYIMGIILVLLFLTLVGGIIWKSACKADPKPIAARRN
jgi:hypothetical protein